MDQDFTEKMKKTIDDLGGRLADVAQNAGERINDMRESQHIGMQISEKDREKTKCREAMLDLLIRMFDEDTFAEKLLRPEYIRIKEIDAEIAALREMRAKIGKHEEEPIVEPTVETTEEGKE